MEEIHADCKIIFQDGQTTTKTCFLHVCEMSIRRSNLPIVTKFRLNSKTDWLENSQIERRSFIQECVHTDNFVGKGSVQLTQIAFSASDSPCLLFFADAIKLNMVEEVCQLVQNGQLASPPCTKHALKDFKTAISEALRPYSKTKQLLIMTE